MGNSKSVGVAYSDPELTSINLVGGTQVMGSDGGFTFPVGNTYKGVTGITALASGGQSGATALTGEYNLISTVANAGDSVMLPTPVLGKKVTVKVSSAAAAACAIFPPTGCTINGLAANASMTMQPGAQYEFFGTSATAWHCASGVNPAPGLTASLRCCATGGVPAVSTTQGTDTATNATTEVYFSEVPVLFEGLSTGVGWLNGSAVAGNVTAYLYDSTGAFVAKTASTAQSGTNAYQQANWTAPVNLKGPASYYIGWSGDTTGGTQKFRTHTLGNFGQNKVTGQVYGTQPATAAGNAPTTFTASLGPIASLF